MVASRPHTPVRLHREATWLLRAWLLAGLAWLPSLAGVPCLLGLAGCKRAVAPAGFGVNLTLDAQGLSARAEVVDLVLSTAGAETYSRVIDVRGLVAGGGVVRARYVPGVNSGTLSFSLVAKDASGATRGIGGDTVSLLPGAAVDLTIRLVDPPVEQPDGGMPPDLLSPLCSNMALDPGEVDVDCGGTCPACEPGRSCQSADDCATRTCLNGHCELASGPPAWLPLPSLPAARGRAAAAALDDGSVYAIGGLVTAPEASVLRFSPTTNDWSAAGALPAPREYMPAVVVSDAIYTPGGVFSPTLGTFDGYTSILGSTGSPPSFTTLARTLTEKRAYHGAALGKNGRIYLVGGIAFPDPTPLGTVLSFDPSMDAAAPASVEPASLPLPRAELGVAADGEGRIVAIGGRIANDSIVGDVSVFDPITGAWVAGPALGVPRRSLGAALGGDGRIYAVGGVDGSGNARADVEVLTADAARWLPLPGLTPARFGAAVTRGWDGRIYAIGGEATAGPNVEVEAYGPRISPGPAMGAPGAVIALSCSNFAASAKITVTFSGDPMGKVAASGSTNPAGSVLPSLVWQVPAVAPGTYVLTATDDRSRYAVRTRFVVP